MEFHKFFFTIYKIETTYYQRNREVILNRAKIMKITENY